jgi:segregation and condensation protein A
LKIRHSGISRFVQRDNRVAIERKADWLVLATRLVLLRSRLLVPESAAAAEAAQRDAATELRRIDEATRMRAAAAWLEARPGLGQDVFARGRPERLGVCLEAEYEVDVIAFLWASLALFDDDADAVDTAHVYRPRWLDVYSLAAARARILRRLADSPEGQPFERLLPPAPASAESAPPNALRQRSAWTSTLVASLELAKQGEVVLTQDGSFAPIQVGSSAHPPRAGAP